jgi:hypothetical protein
LEKAEQECELDAGERAGARDVGAARRKEQDRVLIAEMSSRIGSMFPRCPPPEAAAIAAHTAARGSGRVGRTSAGRKLEEQALAAAVTAAVRHKYTEYDTLLAAGVDRAVARQQVADRVHAILEAWRD